MTPLLRNNLVKLLETWQAEILEYHNTPSFTHSEFTKGRFQQIIDSLKILDVPAAGKENIPGDLANELDEFLGIDEFKV
jgi:hypothetical protein